MSRDLFIDYISRSDARADPDLDKYEVVTRSLKVLSSVSHHPFLAIGLKGVGKSAAFRFLQKGGNVDLVQAISAETQEPQDVPASRPTLQYLPEVRADLVLQALLAYVKHAPHAGQLRKIPDDLHQRINQYTEDLWGKIKKTAGGLGGISILGFGISFRSRAKESEGFRLVPRDKVEEGLSLLTRLTQHISVRLVVDDPEAIFTADERVNDNLIAALVIAAYELRLKLPNFKCVILIKPNVLRALRRVDEFPSLPTDVSVRLTWTDAELFEVLEARAKAAEVSLRDVLLTDPRLPLEKIIGESRSGPRDALRRLEVHLKAFPNEPATTESLCKSADRYASACFDQMYAAYDKQYPGLSRAALILFEGQNEAIPRSNLRTRLDQMIASRTEILPFKDQTWARDSVHFSELLVQFGLAAVQTPTSIVLPFHENYIDEASRADAVFVCIPGLRAQLRRAKGRSSRQQGGEGKPQRTRRS
jgi:hypothetical protein